MSFYDEIFKQKNILRRGWLLRELDKKGLRIESDAEHCYSMTMLAFELMERENLKDLDWLKVIQMISYHELGENIVGDLTPFDGISHEEKLKKEHEAIRQIALKYDMPEIERLWLEFEEGKTAEAKLVKQLDSYDAVLQSKQYASQTGEDKIYKEFHSSCKFSEMYDSKDL